MPTQSLVAVFLFSVVVSFGAVISPGPVSAAIITEAPRQGWRVGPLVASGHSILEFILSALILVGLATLLGSPAIQRALALGGGLILFFIGGSYLLAAWRKSIRLPEPEEEDPPRSPAALVSLGILTTLSNPFWYAWWMTVAAGYLAQAQALGLAGVATFFIGHISTDYIWDTGLAAATAAGRRLMSDAHYRGLAFVTGGFMLYLSGLFLWTGIKA